jgi:hypothetical protein
VTTQGCSAAGLKHAPALSQINFRKQVRVRRVPMVIEAQVQSAAAHRHVAGRSPRDRNVMHEARLIVEIAEQVVLTAQGDSMMAGCLA